MPPRGDETSIADRVRRLEDEVRSLRRHDGDRGVRSFGAVRVGGFVIEVEPGGDLQIRRLSDDATTLLMAG